MWTKNTYWKTTMAWKEIKKKVGQYKDDISAMAIIGTDQASRVISSTDWFTSLNDYSSEVSKAMDKDFLLFLKGKTTEKMAPVYHRIVDGGHDLMSSIERAREVGQEQNWSDIETFKEWAAAYFSDMSSPAGMPAFGEMSEHIYKFLKQSGLSENTARDIVTVNGQEAVESILAGSVTCIAIFFAWKKEDKEIFSKAIGSIILSATVMLNPVSLAIAIIALAVGYQKLVNVEGMARGSIITGSTLAISAIIPGPLMLGLIPAIVVGVYLSKKMGSDFNPIDHVKQIFLLVSSKDFRNSCEEIFTTSEQLIMKEVA